MPILVDSSIWIDYFRDGKKSDKLDTLIDENILVINDLILAEMVPLLKIKNQQKIIRLLSAITKLELKINWNQLIHAQYKCLQNGITGIGLPDLIIAQNAVQNNCFIYSLDHHFKQIKKILPLKLFE